MNSWEDNMGRGAGMGHRYRLVHVGIRSSYPVRLQAVRDEDRTGHNTFE